jgi:serine/threonine-protein kinase
MPNTWKQWEGQIVDWKFPLLRYLGESARAGVYLTERHDQDRLVKAAIKITPAGPDNGELQLSRWRQAAELSHPHLIPIHDMGRVVLDGEPLIYVVMECAEENLGQVLPNRALTIVEARAMLESAVDAFAYLHRQSFVHGRIKPGNIMASGEDLKVSSDGLRRAGEPWDGSGELDPHAAPEYATGGQTMPQPLSPEGDVWSLGMTLVETLTQKLPVVRFAERQDPALPGALQDPFLDIAGHCLRRRPESRWTVEQIKTRLEGRSLATQARPMDFESPTPAPPAARQRAQRSMPLPKRKNYAVPIAAGFVLILGAILAVPKLWRRSSNATKVTATADVPPPAPPAPKKAASAPKGHPVKPSKPIVAKEVRSSKAPVPIPTSIHPEANRDEDPFPLMNELPAGAVVHGEVANQAAPAVLQSARNTIHGTVKVRIKVNVDRSGNVEDAEIESRGPSKYFARVALDAAQLWKFKPAKVGGRGVLSTWIIRFEFRRDGTTAVPTQILP